MKPNNMTPGRDMALFTIGVIAGVLMTCLVVALTRSKDNTTSPTSQPSVMTEEQTFSALQRVSPPIKETLDKRIDTRYGLGIYAFNQKQYDLAWTLLQNVIEESNEYPLAAFVLARMCVRVGNKALAKTYLDETQSRLKYAPPKLAKELAINIKTMLEQITKEKR